MNRFNKIPNLDADFEPYEPIMPIEAGLNPNWWEGYKAALVDLKLEIHKVPTQYDSITVTLLDTLIENMRSK